MLNNRNTDKSLFSLKRGYMDKAWQKDGKVAVHINAISVSRTVYWIRLATLTLMAVPSNC
ncbi:hypothetical protein GCM10009193_24650 [Shewanella aestuarii]|nr:hypothetical protein GCM10009193_24650 [Shewanella aestuarii]